MIPIRTGLSILLRAPGQPTASADAAKPALKKICGGVIISGAYSPDQNR